MNANIVPDTSGVTSSDAQKPDASVDKAADKKANRRGSGARGKRYGNFQAKKNQDADADRFNLLQNKWGLSSHEQQSADALMEGSGVSQPAHTVEIKCETTIVELVKETCAYLESRKVVLPIGAEADMVRVVKLQIKTKEILARRGTSKVQPGDATTSGIERAKKSLHKAPHAIAFYLSQIGKIKYRGQMIYPVSDVQDVLGASVSPGFRGTSVYAGDGRRLYVRLTNTTVVHGEIDIEWVIANAGAIEEQTYLYDDFDGINGLITRYTRIINAVESKMSYLIAEVDFDEAIGTTAQLVGLTPVRGECYTAHSTLPLMDHMLSIGAGCKFGLRSTDKYHDLARAHITRDCYPDTFFTSIQSKPRVVAVVKE